ncbi:hypothetical protein ACMD2_22399 [Ananas comosus]|uniref:Uncharacterized protein n=1 Tax=Ananas comosus TaxID=4615 RepID=A0A199VG58_ANACO|nr:hypothetical protein ACMD2_22399 [Ananas comosus]
MKRKMGPKRIQIIIVRVQPYLHHGFSIPLKISRDFSEVGKVAKMVLIIAECPECARHIL